eukprot:276183_1
MLSEDILSKVTQDLDNANNDSKFCGCFSSAIALRLTLLLEVVMCASAIVLSTILLRNKESHDMVAQGITRLLVFFSIGSCLAVISGVIGVFGKHKLYLKAFGVSSAIASVLWILLCIWLMVWMFIFHTAFAQWQDANWFIGFVLLAVINFVAALRVYGNITILTLN